MELMETARRYVEGQLEDIGEEESDDVLIHLLKNDMAINYSQPGTGA